VPVGLRSSFTDAFVAAIMTVVSEQMKKKRSEETQTLRAGCSKAEPKFCAQS